MSNKSPDDLFEKALKKRLHGLAESYHSELEWQQVQPQQAKRTSWRWGMGIAAAAVLTVAITQLNFNSPATPVNQNTPMLLVENYRLDALEQKIQMAYLRGVNEAELQQLWQQRELLLAQQPNGRTL